MQNQMGKKMGHEMESRLLLALSALRMKSADFGAKFAVRALLSDGLRCRAHTHDARLVLFGV